MERDIQLGDTLWDRIRRVAFPGVSPGQLVDGSLADMAEEAKEEFIERFSSIRKIEGDGVTIEFKGKGDVIDPVKRCIIGRPTFEYLMRKKFNSPEEYTRLRKISEELNFRSKYVFSALNCFIDCEFVEYEWQVDRVQTPEGPRPKGFKGYRLRDNWMDILEKVEQRVYGLH